MVKSVQFRTYHADLSIIFFSFLLVSSISHGYYYKPPTSRHWSCTVYNPTGRIQNYQCYKPPTGGALKWRIDSQKHVDMCQCYKPPTGGHWNTWLSWRQTKTDLKPITTSQNHFQILIKNIIQACFHLTNLEIKQFMLMHIYHKNGLSTATISKAFKNML